MTEVDTYEHREGAMAGFKRPQLEPCPLKDLIDALHQLHLQAGHPSARTLQREVGGVSHTSIHKVFSSPYLPNWGTLELTVEAMARRARTDAEAEVGRFHTLWMRAAGTPNASGSGSNSEDSPPEVNDPLVSSPKTEPFYQPIAHLLPDALDEIEAVSGRSAAGSFRVPTGLDDLDALLGGWTQGSLVVVGGLPSSGKTNLLLNFCRAAAIRYRLPTMFLSGEMNSREIQSRMLSAEARVPLHYMRTAQLQDQDWTRLAHTMGAVVEAPIDIGTPARFEIDILRPAIASLAQKGELKLLLIDGGLHWIADSGYSASAVESALWGLKNLAESGRIPIIISAQAQKPARLPTSIAELDDFGATARVADVVIMLRRPDQDDPENPRAGEADLIAIKNRYGPLAAVTVCYQYDYCRFINMLPSEWSMFPTEQRERVTADETELKTAAHVTSHDIKLYKAYISRLHPEGPIIKWLKFNFLAKAQPAGLFSDLESVVTTQDLDPVGFDAVEIREAFATLVEAIRGFCDKVSWWTWADSGHNWLSVPLDWREDNPTKWHEATDDIILTRKKVIEAYDNFLLVCHDFGADEAS